MSGVGDVIAIITLTFEVGKACKNYLSELRQLDENVQKLDDRLMALGQVAQNLNALLDQFPDKVPTVLSNLKSLTKCRKDLEHIRRTVQSYQDQASKNATGLSSLRRLKWPMSKEQLTADVESLGAYIQDFGIALSIDSTNASFRIEHQVDDLDHLVKSVETKLTMQEQRVILETLSPVFEAAFDSSSRQHEPQCLPDTRTSLLHEIHSWSQDPKSEPIFWLCGMAGTGKSTIAQSLAQKFHDENRLAGSFFFSRSRNLNGLTRADKVFTTLAYQAASHIAWFRRIICATLQDDTDLVNKRMRDQYQKLILEPLRQSVRRAALEPPLVLIVDALDECQDQRDIEMLLSLLSTTHDLETLGVKIILTSRPAQTAIVGFRSMTSDQAWSIKLHDIEKDIVHEDIKRYLEDQFHVIGFRNGLEDGWVGPDIIEKLSSMSESLFIFPATICRFLDSMKSKRRMRQFVNSFVRTDQVENSSLQQLDIMYALILEGPTSSTGYVEDFQTVLGSVLTLSDALNPSTLGALLFQDEEEPEEVVLDVLLPLSSVIVCHDESPITLLHTSFRDFLLDDARCTNRSFRIDYRLAHANLLKACIKVMKVFLKKNIAGLSDPVLPQDQSIWTTVQNQLPAHLRYACRHWTEHLCNSLEVDGDEEAVSFLRSYGLYWIEALVWLEEVPRVTACMTNLQSCLLQKRRAGDLITDVVATQADFTNELLAWTYDINRFMLAYGPVAAIAPPQLYCSAVPFAPARSLIKQSFMADVPDWVRPTPTVEEDWDGRLARFDRGSYDDCTHALAPDSKTLVSVESSGFIQAWNTTTGLLLYRSTHRFLANTFCKLKFAPSGKCLLILTDTLMLLVLEVVSGALLGQRHFSSEPIGSAIFSPSESEIMLLFADGRLIKWDYQSGDASSNETLNTIQRISGRIVGASACLQNLVFEHYPPFARTTEDLETCMTHRVSSTNLRAGTVTIYQVSDGKVLKTIETSLEKITNAYISMNDKAVTVVYSYDFSPHFFDLETFTTDTGNPINKLYGIRDLTVSPSSRAMCFSKGNQSYLYSVSGAGRIVSIAKRRALKTSEIHFSADGVFLAVKSEEDIRLWNTSTHTLLNSVPLPFDTSPALSIAMTDLLTVVDSGGGYLDMWQTSASQNDSRDAEPVKFERPALKSSKNPDVRAVSMLKCQYIQNALILMDAAEGFTYCRLTFPTPHCIYAFHLSPDTRWLVVCSDEFLVLDNQDLDDKSSVLDQGCTVAHEKVLRRGKIQGRRQMRDIVGSKVMAVTVLDTFLLRTIKHFGFFYLDSSRIKFSALNTLLISGTAIFQKRSRVVYTGGHTSFLWDPRRPKELGRVHLDPGTCRLDEFSFSPDGRRLVIQFGLRYTHTEARAYFGDEFVQIVDTAFENGQCRAVTAWPCDGLVKSSMNDRIVVSSTRAISTYEMDSGRLLCEIPRSWDPHDTDCIEIFKGNYIILEATDHLTGLKQTRIWNMKMPEITVHLDGQYHFDHASGSGDSCLKMFTRPKSADVYAESGVPLTTDSADALDYLLGTNFLEISPILMDHTRTWILVKDKPILWIPPSRRPELNIKQMHGIHLHENTVWLQGDNWKLTCLKLDLDNPYNI